MATETRSRLTTARIKEWMQGWVDYSTMEMWGSGEVEGSAFAGVLQRNIQAFVGSAERELGIVLRSDSAHDYWTPEQHNAYQRRATVELVKEALPRMMKAALPGAFLQADDLALGTEAAAHILDEVVA